MLDKEIYRLVSEAYRRMDKAEFSDPAEQLGHVFEYLDRAITRIKATAPDLWQVMAEIEEVIAGRPASFYLPKEFGKTVLAEYVGDLVALVTEGTGAGFYMGLQAASLDIFRVAVAQLPGRKVLPPVLFHGYLETSGHHLYLPNRVCAGPESIARLGFVPHPQWRGEIFTQNCLDTGYCPGKTEDRYRVTRNPVCGQARLTYEGNLTILAIWDSSGDDRPGSNSAYVALGRYEAETMIQLCQKVWPMPWNRCTAKYGPVVIVEKVEATAAAVDLDLAPSNKPQSAE